MKVAMACPIYSTQDMDVKRNHDEIARQSSHTIYRLEVTGICIQIARQRICEQFLKSDADYLFCVDDDIKFMDAYDPNSENPIDILIELDKDIVGGIYVARREPHNLTYRPKDLQIEFEKIGKWPKDYQFKVPKEPFEVEWLSGGCMMMKRELVEKLLKKYSYPFCAMVYKGEFLSEDFAFCKRAIDEGYKVFAEPSIVLGHLGQYFYTISDYLKVKEK